MSLAADVAAIRGSVALTAGDHLASVRVGGSDAHDLLDRVSPQQLFVRTGQMLHTLLLDDAAKPLADVYVCCGDDDYLVIADGMTGPALAAYLRGHADGLDATIVDLSETHAFLCLDGPYAWELLAEVTTPHVIGLPYLSFFDEGRFTCFRAGKTGEYGFDLMIERSRVPEIRELLLGAGTRYDLHEVSLAAIESCMLEAGFLNVRRDVRDGLTPVELQQQWRTTANRTFPGSAALAAHRTGPRGRVVFIASEVALTDDAPILLDGARVGTVLHADRSHTRNEYLALALLDVAVSHPGLSGFVSGDAPVRTISGPAVNNRSLYVDPQRHSWATRATATFPPLLRPRWS